MKGWMELPASSSGSDYYTGVFKDGNDRNYSYLYQYSTYTSLWTAYPLYSATMSGSKSGTWAKNDKIAENRQVNVWDASYNVLYGQTDYVNNASSSGEEYYSRGHQNPDADRSNNSTMIGQTYLATNSTPQIQNAFNGYIWKELEEDIRKIASATDTLYVVTGAAFKKGNTTDDITYIHPKGDPGKDVPVPNYYWKALLKVTWTGSGDRKTVSSAKAIGIWMPHTVYTSTDYSDYVVSVDVLESNTGFDLFANLPDTVESSAESNSNWTTFKNF